MDEVTITQVLDNGIVHRITFRSIFGSEAFAQQYLDARKDMKELGWGALKKWHDEEARERKRLGLRVKGRY